MKTNVRIFKPSKTAMQSGRSGQALSWRLEGQAESAHRADDLIGWVSAEDTKNQIRMTFSSKDAAIDFATQKGWSYDVVEQNSRTVVPRNYLQNFDFEPFEYHK